VVVPADDSVDLICAGAVRLNGQARWDLLACKEHLSRLATEYDLVLMDSAALRADPAVSRLLTLSDHIVCVFDATSSARDDLDSVREHLRSSAKPVHFILNKVLYAADHLFGAGMTQDRRQVTKNGPPVDVSIAGDPELLSGAAAGESRRKFRRHASTLPVVCRTNGRVNGCEQELCNISYSGLSFVGKKQHAAGDILTIEFPFLDTPVDLKGAVVWSQETMDTEGTAYINGVQFVKQPETVLSNLVDRIRQIEDHKDSQRRRTGRKLSSHEAAEELKTMGPIPRR
jgi:hypothetical protein